MLFTDKLNLKEENMKFYNVKLKESVEVDEKDVEIVMMKNGRPAAKAQVEIKGETHKMFKDTLIHS